MLLAFVNLQEMSPTHEPPMLVRRIFRNEDLVPEDIFAVLHLHGVQTRARSGQTVFYFYGTYEQEPEDGDIYLCRFKFTAAHCDICDRMHFIGDVDLPDGHSLELQVLCPADAPYDGTLEDGDGGRDGR